MDEIILYDERVWVHAYYDEDENEIILDPPMRWKDFADDKHLLLRKQSAI